eukprot:scaffold81831_cov15-Prasinocladus_malaysianus.AAC.1
MPSHATPREADYMRPLDSIDSLLRKHLCRGHASFLLSELCSLFALTADAQPTHRRASAVALAKRRTAKNE